MQSFLSQNEISWYKTKVTFPVSIFRERNKIRLKSSFRKRHFQLQSCPEDHFEVIHRHRTKLLKLEPYASVYVFCSLCVSVKQNMRFHYSQVINNIKSILNHIKRKITTVCLKFITKTTFISFFYNSCFKFLLACGKFNTVISPFLVLFLFWC